MCIPCPSPSPISPVARAQEAQSGRDIAAVVSADLERSGLFKPIDPKAFIQTSNSLQVQPRFADWKAINAQALVTGKVEQTQDGQLRVEFRLWDVFGEQQLVGQAYTTTPQLAPHRPYDLDAIYKRIIGEDGYFDTRIVYIAESGPRTRRVKRLAIMDQDGENHRFLTDGRTGADAALLAQPARDHLSVLLPRQCPRVYLLTFDSGPPAKCSAISRA